MSSKDNKKYLDTVNTTLKDLEPHFQQRLREKGYLTLNDVISDLNRELEKAGLEPMFGGIQVSEDIGWQSVDKAQFFNFKEES